MITQYPFKPFDVRLAYLDANLQPLFSRPSPELIIHRRVPNNAFFITRDAADKDGEGVPFYFSTLICDYDTITGHARHFPLYTLTLNAKKENLSQASFLREEGEPKANLSAVSRTYLKGLGLPDPDRDTNTASLLWMHALAIGYSPLYLSENADGIKQDWPRIPLPDDKARLMESAKLGRLVAALLDTENQISGVTAGKVRPELRKVAVITKVGGGNLNFGAGESALTVGWGHGGKDGITMPGKGKVFERGYSPEEKAAIEEGAEDLGLTLEQALAHLGETTCDIHLNETAYWKNVPQKVWDYTIGGYQVIKKWLSYREQYLLGRALTAEEITEVTNMARRIAAIVLLEHKLDDNYLKIKENTYAWK